MPKLIIDGQEVEVPNGSTVMQAAEKLGIEIAHFCYHPKLKIAGNCRMCLVEMEKSPKPVASCAMPVADNMVIYTKSEKAKKAREGVMEFLLINHPLDCPICDQGGECDLQDQAMAFGRGETRYEFPKRSVKPKNMGPLVQTFMNRCIHCTRCIRFATDIAGVSELGTIGRGEHMEIISYLDKTLTSELSGNVVDLCPVGALTSKPYAYKARQWELTKTESIDVMDAVGSNIRVDSFGPKVYRILPRLNEDINEEWISDKTRHACDGLSQQRLDQPYLKVDGKLQPVSWNEALDAVAKVMKKTDPSKIAAIAGDMADVESMACLKDLMTAIGSKNTECRQDGASYGDLQRNQYTFNTTIAGIEAADCLLLIGSHPRYEAPMVNARIRKRYLMGGFKVARVGATPSQRHELTYPVENLGDSPSDLATILSGKSDFAKAFKEAKNPMIIIGNQALTRPDTLAIMSTACEIAKKYNLIREDWNGFNVLHQAASRVGGLDIGFVSDDLKLEEMKVVYLLGADEIDIKLLKKAFVIYQGSHGDAGAHVADVILPGSAYTEKSGTYVNTEGRVQTTTAAVQPPGEAKEDWKIISLLSEHMGHKLPYDTIKQVRDRMAKINPVFANPDELMVNKWVSYKSTQKLNKEPFTSWNGNFYMTDPISRNSVTMAKCTQEIWEAVNAA